MTKKDRASIRRMSQQLVKEGKIVVKSAHEFTLVFKHFSVEKMVNGRMQYLLSQHEDDWL